MCPSQSSTERGRCAQGGGKGGQVPRDGGSIPRGREGAGWRAGSFEEVCARSRPVLSPAPTFTATPSRPPTPSPTPSPTPPPGPSQLAGRSLPRRLGARPPPLPVHTHALGPAHGRSRSL